MTEQVSNEAGRSQHLFVELTGETTLRERQQVSARSPRLGDGDVDAGADGLAEYVAEVARTHGLDDAIDHPDGADTDWGPR